MPLTQISQRLPMSLPIDPFIFVSYSSKDTFFVRDEIKRLEREGYKVWYDQGALQLTHLWATKIREAITACTCFVVFITEDSVLSDNVCDEIKQALTEDKPFIGVYVDNVRLPDDLQTLVRQIQTLDRHSMHRSAYEERLSNALSERIRPIPPPPPPPKNKRIAPQIDSPPDRLPKVVVFALLVGAGLSWFFAVMFNLAAPFFSRSPEELRSNQLAGLILGIMLFVLGLALMGAAYAVFRMYLRSKK